MISIRERKFAKCSFLLTTPEEAEPSSSLSLSLSGRNGDTTEGIRCAELSRVCVRGTAVQGTPHGRDHDQLLRELLPAAPGAAGASGKEVGACHPQQRGGVVLPGRRLARRVQVEHYQEVSSRSVSFVRARCGSLISAAGVFVTGERRVS